MNSEIPFRIFITGSSLVDEAKEILNKNDCITNYGNPLDSPEELKEKLQTFNPDGLIVRQGKIRKDTLEVLPNLKIICKHGVGVDNIDVDAATEKGIPVMITANANFESVAEHALALLLALLKRIPIQDAGLRKGVFNKVNYDGEDLVNKTIGIIGFGRIGRRFAELLTCFNNNILVYDPYLPPENFPEYIKPISDLNLLYKSADVIGLFCQLGKETRGLINKDAISLMKPTAYILNTARGGLINESDLISALQQKQIAGAALDTFETEPPKADNPLFKLENVILTSHVGGASKNALINMGVGAVEHVLSVLTGKDIDKKCIVNGEPNKQK